MSLPNSTKALKDDSVPDQAHHTAKNGQEHCDDSVGSLALGLQGNIPHVTITVFLTYKQQAATSTMLSC